MTKRHARDQEEKVKKFRMENEQLKQSKRQLNEDLQKLLARRADIEQLQSTLVGLIQNSNSRKIDVDELKSKLASSVRQTRHQPDSYKSDKNVYVSQKANMPRSKSREQRDFSLEKTAKRGEDEAVPAWYKVLKKNLN